MRFPRIPGLVNGDNLLAPLILLLGIAGSISLFLLSYRADDAEAHLHFRMLARDAVSSIETRIVENTTTVEALSALFNASDYVDRHEFHVFSQPFVNQNKSIQALQWVQYLKDDQRDQLIARARQDGLSNFNIRDLGSVATSQPSPRRQDYYVVYYNEPSNPNSTVTGLDNGSDPCRKATLTQAIRRGTATASPPITLAQGTKGHQAYLIYIPVYATPTIRDEARKRADHPSGFAAGVFRVDALLTSALSDNQLKSLKISVTDITQPTQPIAIGVFGEKSTNKLGQVKYQQNLHVAGRIWQIEAAPGLAYHSAEHGATWIRLLLSVILTITVARFFSYRAASIRKLRENEDRFRYIIKHNPNAIAVFDNDMNILHVSDRFIEDYRVAQEDIVGKNHYEVFPEIPQRWKDVHARCLAGAIEGEDEDIFPRQDGSVDYTRWECRPWRYADGSIGGMIAYTEVITERKLAEIALEEKSNLLTCLLNSIPDVIFFKDKNGVYQGCNPAFCELTGRPKEQIIGYTDSELLPLDLATECMKSDMLIYEAGESIYQEEWVSYPDGRRILLGVLKAPLRSSSGNLIGIIGVGRDNTERYLANEALRESEARFRQLIEGLENIAVQGYSPDGTVHYWNRANQAIYGYTAEEAMGQNLLDLIIPHEMRESVRDEVRQACATGQPPVASELVLVRKDGEPVQVYSSHVVLRLPGQEPVLYCFDIDISERKRAEAALQKSNRKLEEATALARKMAAQAESASAAKSEFLANMSHEIRTPLNGIIGMTTLLMDSSLSAEQRKFAEIISSSGLSLMGLINDILDFSKIEAGKLEIEKLEFHLPSLLDDLASVLSVKAHDKGLDLICAAEPDVPENLIGDPNRIRQVLTNLIGNAIKFTEAGEVSILVSVDAGNENEAVLRFGVRDTGIGIAQDKFDAIFKSFSQADPSTSRKYGGTGLGLAISKHLVELMGGQIGFTSEEGQGSVFWFTLPFSVSSEASLPNLPAAFSGRRVLLVDPNPVSRGILQERLTALNMQVGSASNWFEALDKLDEASKADLPYQAALVDYQSKGLSGVNLGRFIRTGARYPGLSLVMMANIGQLTTLRTNENSGFSAFLPKPVRQQDLINCLSRLFNAEDTAQLSQFGNDEPSTAATYAPDASSCRILLAEDNPTNQMVALGMLRKMGLKADVVANGRDALQALECRKYDLVLMDVQMPEMNGYEATRRLRSQCEGINLTVPVVAMTANAMAGDREKCLEAGMDDYIAKPIRLNEFRTTLTRWLNRQQAAA